MDLRGLIPPETLRLVQGKWLELEYKEKCLDSTQHTVGTQMFISFLLPDLLARVLFRVTNLSWFP